MNFYRQSPGSDVFPIDLYYEEKIEEPVKNFYQLGDDLIEIKDLINFCNEKNGEIIYNGHQHTKYIDSANFVWELEIDSFYYIIATDWVEMKTHKEKNSKNWIQKILEDEYKKEKYRTGVQVLSNASVKHFNSFIEEVKKLIRPPAPTNNEIALIVRGNLGYDTVPFDLPLQEVNLEMNYGKDFLPIHEKIIKRLESPDNKGLVLLHGKPGTGKTFYLKHLASLIKNKRILFIPPYLADAITSPDMMPFLVSMKNSILFIEDAEKVITDRNTNGSVGVSNILNLTDGILSDILNIQIVATFNMDMAKIDEALLRKGRLIAEREFKELNVEDSNKLINHLGIEDFETKEPMTLTDIYNLKEVEFKTKKKEQKIGFN